MYYRIAGDVPLTCSHLLQHIGYGKQQVKIDGMNLGWYEGTVDNALYGYDGEWASDKLLNANVYGIEPEGEYLLIFVESF